MIILRALVFCVGIVNAFLLYQSVKCALLLAGLVADCCSFDENMNERVRERERERERERGKV